VREREREIEESKRKNRKKEEGRKIKEVLFVYVQHQWLRTERQDLYNDDVLCLWY
jgi:hypothetical protein